MTSLGLECMQYIIDSDGRIRPHGSISYKNNGQTLRTEYWENGMYKGHQGYSSSELINYFNQMNTPTNSLNLDDAYTRLFKSIFND